MIFPAALLATSASAQFNLNGGQKPVGVQLFQWPFKSIEKECVEFLAPNGYSWVQTSPINAHPKDSFDGFKFSWYLAYQPLSYKIGNRLGTEQDFIDMVKTCKDVGVDIVVDVVLNHNAYVDKSGPDGFGTDKPWSTKAFAQNLPDANYTAEHYHDSICNENIGANWDREFNRYNCRAVTLTDLKTSHPFVRSSIANYLNRLMDIGVAGFRTDLAVCVPVEDWRAIFAQVKRNYKGEVPYLGQEAYDFPSQNFGRDYRSYPSLGRIYNIDYTNSIGRAFTNVDSNTVDQIPNLLNSLSLKEGSSSVFVENHDQERNVDGERWLPLSRRNNAWWYKQAVAFNILYPYGYSLVHSGYTIQWFGGEEVRREEPISAPYNATGYILPVNIVNGVCRDGWVCQHRFPDVYPLVKVRNFVGDFKPTINTNGPRSNQIWWTVPGKALVAINSAQGLQQNQDMTNIIQSTLPPGTYCNQVLATATATDCQLLPGVTVAQEQVRYVVGQDGRVQLNIKRGDRTRVAVLYTGPGGRIGNDTPTTTSSTVTPTSSPVSAQVNFEVTHDAGFGDNVYIVGSFNGWNTCQAVTCSARTNNGWSCGPLPVQRGTQYEWKAIKYGTRSQTTCRNPIWMPGANVRFVGGDSVSRTSF
jgi:hypothetical protein